jgi:hypothetical protein
MCRCSLLLLVAGCGAEIPDSDPPEPEDTSYARGEVWRVVPERCGQDTDRVAEDEYGVITFVNRYSLPIEIVLVDEHCLEFPAVLVEPGERQDVGAYLGWVFRLYDEEVLLSSWYMPLPGGGLVVAQP